MDEKNKKLEEDLKKSKEKSLSDLKRNIEIHRNSLEIQEAKLVLLKELFKVSLKGIELINPERKFQTYPEYWELMKKWEEIEHKHKVLAAEVDIERTKKVLNETLEQYRMMGGE